MAKLGIVDFQPQHRFSQDERRAIRARLKANLKGVHGYVPFPELVERSFVARCRDPHGRRINTFGTLKQVFDYDVTRR